MLIRGIEKDVLQRECNFNDKVDCEGKFNEPNTGGSNKTFFRKLLCMQNKQSQSFLLFCVINIAYSFCKEINIEKLLLRHHRKRYKS